MLRAHLRDEAALERLGEAQEQVVLLRERLRAHDGLHAEAEEEARESKLNVRLHALATRAPAAACVRGSRRTFIATTSRPAAYAAYIWSDTCGGIDKTWVLCSVGVMS